MLRDPVRFSSRETVRPTVLPPAVEAVLHEGYAHDDMRPLVASDPPHHTRVRKFLNATFTPRTVAELTPRIRVLADQLAGAMEPLGAADIIERFCYPFPLTVILELLGLPQSDRELVHAFGLSKVALQWGGNMPIEDHIAHARRFVEFQRYFEREIVERRRSPGNDLVSRLVTMSFEGERPLETGELVGQLMGLVTAGHETTTNLIAHALIQLLRDGSAWQRYDTSVIGMMRVATEDVTLGGVPIPAGAKIQLMRVGRPRRVSVRRRGSVPDRPEQRQPPHRVRQGDALLPRRSTRPRRSARRSGNAFRAPTATAS